MKIGILGAGNIGGNLGRRWGAAGHDVRFGVRDASKVSELVGAIGDKASAGDVAGAVAFGDVVVLAVPGGAVDDAVAAAGDLKGKILIDATNVLKWDDGPMPAKLPSSAEALQEKTGARVIKAFNTLGAEHILEPVVGGLKADTFICGDDADARKTVKGLATEIGFNVVDMGPLRYAGVLEHIAVGWIYLAMKGGLGRGIAFKVVGV